MNSKKIVFILVFVIVGLVVYGIAQNNMVKELKGVHKGYEEVKSKLTERQSKYDSLQLQYKEVTDSLKAQTEKLQAIHKNLDELFKNQRLTVGKLKEKLEKLRNGIDTSSTRYNIPKEI